MDMEVAGSAMLSFRNRQSLNALYYELVRFFQKKLLIGTFCRNLHSSIF